jgi:hypothetical protein
MTIPSSVIHVSKKIAIISMKEKDALIPGSQLGVSVGDVDIIALFKIARNHRNQ